MLDTLPPEILEQILGHLPSAASIVNVACVSRTLYDVVSTDDYAVFRAFVKKAFPTIQTPPIWRQMACRLASRSRAWDRRAFIARECCPPKDPDNGPAWLGLSGKFGFVPVIDSYERYPGSSSSQREEVMAFGAAGRLRIRTLHGGKLEWSSLRREHDHLPQFDIVDLKLLRPGQRMDSSREAIILRRADHEVALMEMLGKDNFRQVSAFEHRLSSIHCMDVNAAAEPLLALSNSQSMLLFALNGAKDAVSTMSTTALEDVSSAKRKMKCMKFLTSNTIATSFRYATSTDHAPIQIFDIRASGIDNGSIEESRGSSLTGSGARHAVNTIAPLDDIASLAGRPGQVFLSGWTDGVARLYDRRTADRPAAEYTDHVDDGQIVCLLACGHEKFFAGSHQNACLKVFDMRMPGARKYSHLDAPVSVRRQAYINTSNQTVSSWPTFSVPSTRRDINIFLALTVNRGGSLWQPLPRRNLDRLPRYRGSIYALSSPSASSPTVYAGIENHVLQLDFVSTDDVKQENAMYGMSAGFTLGKPDDILNLSCYERPRDNHVATDSVLLRKQIPWTRDAAPVSTQDGPGINEEGWDERWRLGESWKDRLANGENRWRRR